MKELKEQLDRIEAYASLGAKQILTIKEAMLLTGLSRRRIYALTSAQEIPHYKQGGLYFKRTELEQWLTMHKVPTKAEIQSQAILHTLNNPR